MLLADRFGPACLMKLSHALTAARQIMKLLRSVLGAILRASRDHQVGTGDTWDRDPTNKRYPFRRRYRTYESSMRKSSQNKRVSNRHRKSRHSRRIGKRHESGKTQRAADAPLYAGMGEDISGRDNTLGNRSRLAWTLKILTTSLAAYIGRRSISRMHAMMSGL
jgi:hypothetical protein